MKTAIIDKVREFLGIETRSEGEPLAATSITTEGQMLSAIVSDVAMTKDRAKQIPSVKAALNLIKGAVRETPIKLFEKDENGQIHEVLSDRRVFLLNDDTGDTLNSSQMKDALIEDYFLLGGGYCYINRKRNDIVSLHYVENEDVSVIKNDDPIFKDYDILVRDGRYKPFDFFKILRDTKDGAEGRGLIKENDLILKVAYNSLKFENNLVATGGNKKGFIKSAKTLADHAIAKLKEAWRRLYSTNDENVVVLNNGLEFQESSNTSVEMQLNENKQTNAAEIAKIFNIPLGMISGTGTSAASEDDKMKFIDFCVVPFLSVIENALNRDLLLESEKGKRFFACDTKDIKKGSILERFQAYEIGIRTNVMQLNECRKEENLPPIDYDFINLGLSAVLYDPKSSKVFVPNTGETLNMSELFEKGGNSKNGDENTVEK
ncbi:MAG: phage portal protein [Faecalibacterium sp.]|nr:phage portal protein [Ruminococcus sp.]MCM1392097.1 phage portal protein [Ruminococcus sp.]MCM1485794.1 phage portal protein [Faecalibacterium sp.]